MDFVKCACLLVFLLSFSKTGKSQDQSNLISAFECPPHGDHYYSHPNCRMFIVCSNGIYYELSCPLNLFWNPETETCGYDSSYCSKPSSTTSPTTHATSTEQQPSTPEPEEPTTSRTEEPTREPTREPTTLPDRTTKPTETPEPKPTTTPEPKSTTWITEEPTREPTMEPTKSSTENPFPCPETGYFTLQGKPCNIYYRCLDGELLGVYTCGALKWFDSRTESCVNPSESDCPYD